MEINRKDLEVKLTKNVKRRYRTQVGKNLYYSNELRDLKIKRNWILGNEIDDGSITGYDVRNYGNLIMERSIEDNILTRIYNECEPAQYFQTDYKASQKDKEYVESVLGITEDMKIINKYIDGKKITKRGYMNFAVENPDLDIEYEELLHIAINILNNEENFVRSYNDKKVYANDKFIITLTNNVDITNIIVKKGGKENERN